MEKVNLACGECGIQEVTSGTVIVIRKRCFRMKEVDEKGNSKENEKKSQIGELFHFCTHAVLYAFYLYITMKEKNVNLPGRIY